MTAPTGQRQPYGDFSLLHPDPVVLYAWDPELRDEDAALLTVLEALAPRPVRLIVTPSWTVRDPGSRAVRVAEIRQLMERVPSVTVVAICPTLGEATAFAGEGIPTLHCSEAALVREDQFRPLATRNPTVDAIYDAKWADYKRHDLAGEISSLGLIAPPPWRPSEGCTIDYFRRAHAAVRHATWFSRPWGGRRWISSREVNEALNQARAGLCLSSVEGIMAASIQYLLAGLPVVTTANVGGRDEFFDPAYVRWVDDDPAAVSAAVDELVDLELDPWTIREATLDRVRRHRERLQMWIRGTIVAGGGELGRWANGWPPDLPNKFREPRACATELIAEIERGTLRPSPARPASPRPRTAGSGRSERSVLPPAPVRRASGFFSLAHADPLVLLTADWEILDPKAALHSVLDANAGHLTYVAVQPSWTVFGGRAEELGRCLHELSARLPGLSAVVCCATAGEVAYAQRFGLAALHCSPAAGIRTDFFTVHPQRQPRFDAIYDAQWADYKRHDLAGDIGSVALIAPRPWRPEACTIEFFSRAHAALGHATWISSPWRGDPWLSPAEINDSYGHARVGLCLSALEGHMSASIQYLLAGLPIVTTPSRGGRDEFFDPGYVRWTSPEPAAVARAVAELAELELDPLMIRDATLAKLAHHRGRLQAWIRAVIDRAGGDSGRWSGDWPADLPNKFRDPAARAADVIAEIEQAR